jgi:hypothetical protein
MQKLLILEILLLPSLLSKMVWLSDIANTGARYPIYDIYDGKVNPSLKGKLNTVGMRQQYLLGSYLRSDYIDRAKFIDEVYSPNTVEVFACNDIDTTYSVAIARLYGLFPIGSGWRIPPGVDAKRLDPPFQSNFSLEEEEEMGDDAPFALNLGFQPVPIWPMDDILNDPCPNAGLIKTKRLQEIAKNLTAFEAQHSVLMAKARLVFNLTVLQMNIPSMSDLHDTLISDITIGKTLPTEWNDYDMKSLRFISDYYNTLLYEGSYALTFSTLMLTAVKQKMEMAMNHTLGDKKWSIFSTREGTMIPLMILLNLTSSECLN